MKKFLVKKLVRDFIAWELIAMLGKKVIFRKLKDRKTYSEALREKLIEEARELDFSNRKRLLEELADVAEVILTICRLFKISTTELEQARRQKNKRRGSFSKRVFVSTVTLPNNSPLIQHFDGKFPTVSSAKPQ